MFSSRRARDGTRTRDPDLGKVVLHQLSHSRDVKMFISQDKAILHYHSPFVNHFFKLPQKNCNSSAAPFANHTMLRIVPLLKKYFIHRRYLN